MEVNINNENFKNEVLGYNGIVIVDFFGSWCMPCRMLAPTLHKVCDEHNIKLAKVDIDENEELCREYKIMSVPTLKIFKHGELINSSVGVISESQLLNLIK